MKANFATKKRKCMCKKFILVFCNQLWKRVRKRNLGLGAQAREGGQRPSRDETGASGEYQ
jgi:hypothetical protein